MKTFMVRLQENTHFIYDKNELMGLSDESNYKTIIKIQEMGSIIKKYCIKH